MARIKALPVLLLQLAMIGGVVATILFVLDALLLDQENESG